MTTQQSLYQIHSDGSIWQYEGPPITEWTQLDSNPQSVGIAVDESNGQLYQLHNDGSIWQYVAPANWVQLDTNPATVAIAAGGGQLYQLHNDGSIWHYVTPPFTGWTQLDNNPAAVSIAVDHSNGQLYQLHNDGSIWQYTTPPFTGWTKLDENPACLAIVAAKGNLYQLHCDGSIWQYVKPPITGWTQLDNNWNSCAIAIDQSTGQLYQVRNDANGNGSIWQYEGVPMTGWTQLDNNGKTIAITASGGQLYQLHQDGTIWLYVDPSTGWTVLDTNSLTAAIIAGGDTIRRGAFLAVPLGQQIANMALGSLPTDGTLMSVNGATNLSGWINAVNAINNGSFPGTFIQNIWVTSPGGILPYQINVFGGATSDIGSIKFEFTDATDGTYNLEIIEHAPECHTVRYSSDNPTIVSILWTESGIE